MTTWSEEDGRATENSPETEFSPSKTAKCRVKEQVTRFDETSCRRSDEEYPSSV